MIFKFVYLKCSVCSIFNSSKAKFCRHCGLIFSCNKEKKAEYNHNDNWFRGNLLWIAPALQSKFLSTMEYEERLVANSMHLCP